MTNTPYTPLPNPWPSVPWAEVPQPDTDFGYAEVINCDLNFQDYIVCVIDREQEKSAMKNRFLTLSLGDSKQYVCYVKDRNLNPINISNAVCYLKVWEDTTQAPIITKATNVSGEGLIGAADKGEFYFYLVPADTENLSAQQYPYEISVDINGNHYTVSQGIINMESHPVTQI